MHVVALGGIMKLFQAIGTEVSVRTQVRTLLADGELAVTMGELRNSGCFLLFRPSSFKGEHPFF